jgi:hypothetical protein
MPRVLPAAFLLGLLLAMAFVPLAEAAPTVALTLSPAAPNGLNGWYSTRPSVQLAGAGGTGGYALTYCTDATDACVPGTAYTAAFTAPEGNYYLRYQARELGGAGELSAIGSMLMLVDDTAPDVSVLAPAADDTSPDARLEFHFSERMDRDSVEDALVAEAAWDTRWTDGARTLVLEAVGLADGTHRVAVGTGARDAHGVHLEEGRDYYLTTLAPRAPSTPRSVSATQAVEGARVTWASPSDAGTAPIEAYVVRVQPAGAAIGEPTRVAASAREAIVPLAPGDYTVRVTAENAVGEGAGASVALRMLATPISEVVLAPAEPDGHDGWYLGSPDITFLWTEGATVWWRFGDGAMRQYTGPIDAPAGLSTLTWQARHAGGSEGEHALTLRVDDAPPVLSRTTLSPSAPTAGAPLTIAVDARDAEAGLAELYVLVDDARHDIIAGEPLALAPLPQGEHTIQTIAIDRAGRVAYTEPASFVVVAAPPIVEPTPGGSDEPTPEPPSADGVRVLVDAEDARLGGTRGDARVRVEGAAAGSRTAITLIDEEGARRALVEGAWWDTRGVPNGYYLVEVVETPADGSPPRVASAEILVQNAHASSAQVAAVIVGGALLALAAANAARIFGRPRPKKEAALSRRLAGWPSLALAGVALAALALVYAYAEVEPFAWAELAAALPMVGGVSLVFLVGVYGIDTALAWSQGLEVKFRLWGVGLLSLAASGLLFRQPFGLAGHLDEQGEARPNDRRADGLRAMGSLGGALVLVLPFLILGRAADYRWGDLGIELVLGYAALCALPIAPFPGAALWRWRRAAWVGVAPLALLPYPFHQLGYLPPGAILALGLAGGALCASGAALLGRPAWRRAPEAAAPPPGPIRASVETR